LDLHNTAWIRSDYEIVDQAPPPVWPEAAGQSPHGMGYWRNNVKAVLIQGRTKGVQESEETLAAALYTVSLLSQLFRNGINLDAPVPITTAVRLTDEEAHAILQKQNGNSKLARALQHNLAAWLNLGSGRVAPDTIVSLDVHGGPFEGTIMEALLEAQDIILNGGDLQRAKDIAGQINAG
jgi:hypothetical protein